MTNAVFTEIYNPKNWIKCAFNCRKHTKTKERFWQSRKTNKKKKEVHQEYLSNDMSQHAKQKTSRDNNTKTSIPAFDVNKKLRSTES
ncbi:uncharacterized protein LOC108736383 isoform X3 [Agrilus planipennis]|uniref:Uncharacterized protein LOC108736383 isoform X3 n=1 Tax=Agrilus planipennis TaxID=224129 RepID=A0A1W4WW52_AGRPL|nr:uncharacterized protein LOC108736383 isoform X3 [Agrilus planipennis]